jgi:hypothetical protein
MKKVQFSVVQSNGVLTIKGANLSEKELSKLQGRIEAQLNKEQVKELKDLQKDEKNELKDTFRGLFNTFNYVKKNAKVLKVGAKVTAFDVIGQMTFNELIARVKNGGAYSIDLMYNLCVRYNALNDADKIESLKRGEIFNELLKGVKSGVFSGENVLTAYVELFGFPTEKNKKGDLKTLVSHSTAKYIQAHDLELFTFLALGEKYPVLVTTEEGVQIVDSVE